MSVAKDFETPEDVIFPPGDLESNEPPLETYLHLQQMLLLINVLIGGGETTIALMTTLLRGILAFITVHASVNPKTFGGQISLSF